MRASRNLLRLPAKKLARLHNLKCIQQLSKYRLTK